MLSLYSVFNNMPAVYIVIHSLNYQVGKFNIKVYFLKMGILLYHDIGVLFMKYVYSTIYKTTISNSTIKTHCIINTKYFICHTRKGQLTIHQEYSKYSIHQQPRTRIVFPTPWFICCYGGQVCRGPSCQ